jgi:MoxR-like ATPase
MTTAEVMGLSKALTGSVSRVVVGKEPVVRLLLAALLSERHVLIEDVPGTGKTTLVKTLARSLGASFTRLQFTPDLLPTDVTGFYALDPRSGDLRFRPGPLFSQIVLVDEINRASPKTQSSLLEAMEERQVTVDGATHPLPRPFLVLATQNPVEYEGTFPLPEAQLDRFGLRLHLGYPTAEEEGTLLRRFIDGDPLSELTPVATVEDVLEATAAVRAVYVDDALRRYVVELVAATRRNPDVVLGASPRCALALVALGQAMAAMAGRDYVLPDDVKAVAPAAMAHRVLLTPAARWRDVTADSVVAAALRQTTVPTDTRPARSRGAASV